MQSVLWYMGWAVWKTGGWEDVDVGGLPVLAEARDPRKAGTRIVSSIQQCGNKCSGQSTSSPALSHIGTQEKRRSVPYIPSSRYTLKTEPMEKVNQGSTIKLHDYKVPCRPDFCMPFSTLRNPRGSNVDC